MRRQGEPRRRASRPASGGLARRVRPTAIRLLLAAAVFPFATTSIARQDATSLLSAAADLADGAGGHFLAAEPRRPLELASLEAADLFGSGRGPMVAADLLGGGESLVVADMPEAVSGAAKFALDEPFVDRTLKGDRRLARVAAPEPDARSGPEPDPFDALPALGDALALDLTGVNILPPIDAAKPAPPRPRPTADWPQPAEAAPSRQTLATTPKRADAAPAGGGVTGDSAVAEPAAAAATTSVPMRRREETASHDGSTPSVASLSGGVSRATTTPASETPVEVAALPVSRGGAVERVALTPSSDPEAEGETTALRDDVPGDGKIETRLAHRLVIPERQLARAEQCLAEAIYFEARGEPIEGQYAVAQVVMNRARSGYYPSDVCGVVYQNKQRRNACQFSFACDRIPDRVTNKHAWTIAARIAQDVAQGGAWLPEVGDSTHYHATYVRPYWLGDMIKEEKIGRHIFYRVKWRAPLDAQAALEGKRPG
jgi:spore germination cell wall hydrolase CwlJ-like protein